MRTNNVTSVVRVCVCETNVLLLAIAGAELRVNQSGCVSQVEYEYGFSFKIVGSNEGPKSYLPGIYCAYNAICLSRKKASFFYSNSFFLFFSTKQA